MTTRACPSCTLPTDDSTRFCTSCGAFVAWSEEPPAPTRPRPRAPSTPPPSVRPVDMAVEDARPAPPSTVPPPPPDPDAIDYAAMLPPPQREVARGPDPGLLRALARTATGVSPHGRRQVRGRRRPMVEIVVQPDDDPDDDHDPHDEGDDPTTPVLPQREFEFASAALTATRRPSRTPGPDDVICPRCMEANMRCRTFCRRCALELEQPMDDMPVEAPLPWWRRLFRRAREMPRERRRYRAGERPSRRARRDGRGLKLLWFKLQRSGRVIVSYILAIVAVLGLLIGVLPAAEPWRDRIVSTLDGAGDQVQEALVPSFTPVNPIDEQATSELAGNPVANLADGFSETYWAEAAEGPGIGEVVQITFAEPTRLARIGFLSGGVPEGQPFDSQPRPRQIAISFDDSEETPATIELLDDDAFQDHALTTPPITTLTIRILTVYPATADGGSDLSIREIEFLRRV